MYIKINEVCKDHLPFVAQPSFAHLGAEVIGTILLDIDNVYIDNIEGNTTRSQAKLDSLSHIQNLKTSFADGIDLNQLPPCVIKTTDKTKNKTRTDKPYELVYGYHRLGAMRELSAKKYFFTEIDAKSKELYRVKVSENEPLPKLDNREADISNTLAKMIRDGELSKNEVDVRKELNLMCRGRKKQSKDNIMQKVIHQNGIPKRYEFYSESQAWDWINNYTNDGYCIGGEFDENRDMYGFICKEGYLYRTLFRALKKYTQEGKKSYVISQMGEPSVKVSMTDKRKNFQSEMDSIMNMFKLMGVDNTDFLIHMGSMPQDHSVDNFTKLVEPIREKVI